MPKQRVAHPQKRWFLILHIVTLCCWLTLSQNLAGLVSYGFVGNTFEVSGTTAVVGTLLYVASVPDGE